MSLFLRIRRERQRQRGPGGSGGRDKLILPIREAAVEVRLDPDRARFDMPRAVIGLGAQQEIYALAEDRIARRHPAGVVESKQGFTGGVSVRGQRGQLAPSAVDALQRGQGFRFTADPRRRRASPGQPQQAEGMVLICHYRLIELARRWLKWRLSRQKSKPKGFSLQS